MHKKRAFIVTDTFLYKNGNTKPIEDKLDAMGIVHTCFSNVQPDPTLKNALEGTAQMRAFEPDVIIAFGGGSAMDAAKIMWVLYENPDADFSDMAMDFMDIRKRIYMYPEMGKKAYFVAIPTDGQEGLLRSDPDLLRHRLRSHTVRDHHGQRRGHQVSAGRL